MSRDHPHLLKAVEEIDKERAREALKRKTAGTGVAHNLKQQKLSDLVGISPVMELCANLAVRHGLSFRIFDSKDMDRLTKLAKKGADDNSKLSVNSENVKKSIAEQANLKRHEFTKLFKGKILNLSADFATCEHRSFLGINCQFFDEANRSMRVVNISCKEVLDRHFAINIKRWILEEIETFKINPEQIFVMSVDSAANITKAVRDVIAHLNEKVFSGETENEPDEIVLNDDEENAVNVKEFLDENFQRKAEAIIPEILKDTAVLVPCSVHKYQLGMTKFLWKDEQCLRILADVGNVVTKLRTPVVRLKLKSEG